MTFLSFAVATLMMTMASADISFDALNARNHVLPSSSSLLRQAKPVNEAAKRHLEENQFEINGLYSVRFHSCQSLTVQNEEMVENYYYQASNGQLISQQSYVMFDVCYGTTCGSDTTATSWMSNAASRAYSSESSSDNTMTFLTDMSTFVQALADFLPNQQEAYCEACQENQESCQYQNYGDNNGNNNYNYNGNNNNRQRHLEEGENDGSLFVPIDCTLCAQQGCFNEGQENNGMEQATEWLQGLAECQEIEQDENENNNQNQNGNYNYNYNNGNNQNNQNGGNNNQNGNYNYNYNNGNNQNNQNQNNQDQEEERLSAGLICNAAGNGVEIALFADDECTLYSNNQKFGDVMSSYDYYYYQQSKNMVEYMFTNDFSCQPTTYTAPNSYYANNNNNNNQQNQNNQQNNQNNQNYNYEVPEATEFCQALFQEAAVDMYDCGYNYNNQDNNNNQNNGEYDEYLYNYDWYNYQLTQEQAEDFTSVCQYIQDAGGKDAINTVYSKQGSGYMYNYKYTVASGNDIVDSTKETSDTFSRRNLQAGGILFLMLVAMAAVAVGGVYSYKKFKASRTITSDKEQPLVVHVLEGEDTDETNEDKANPVMA